MRLARAEVGAREVLVREICVGEVAPDEIGAGLSLAAFRAGTDRDDPDDQQEAQDGCGNATSPSSPSGSSPRHPYPLDRAEVDDLPETVSRTVDTKSVAPPVLVQNSGVSTKPHVPGLWFILNMYKTLKSRCFLYKSPSGCRHSARPRAARKGLTAWNPAAPNRSPTGSSIAGSVARPRLLRTAPSGHAHRRRRDRGGRPPLRRPRHLRRGARPHGLLGVALPRDARAPHGPGHERRELSANPQARATVVHDLNVDPRLPFAAASFDAAVCCVSVDYLIRPIEVFADVARTLRPDAPFACTFSNRCFPTKAIRGWLASTDEQHCEIVARVFRERGRLPRRDDRASHPVGASRGPAVRGMGAAPIRVSGPARACRAATHRPLRRRVQRPRSRTDRRPPPWRGTSPGRRGAGAARPTRLGYLTRCRCWR